MIDNKRFLTIKNYLTLSLLFGHICPTPPKIYFEIKICRERVKISSEFLVYYFERLLRLTVEKIFFNTFLHISFNIFLHISFNTFLHIFLTQKRNI